MIASESIKLFRQLTLRHGALGSGNSEYNALQNQELLNVAPLFFKLMPAEAIRTDRPYTQKIKPIISEHLEALGFDFDDELLSIIKALCDQYHRTAPKNPRRPSKFSMADIRANGAYKGLLQKQNYRCLTCGHSFRDHGGETLDHIVPWRLIGDNSDGSNWQLLCADCNTGKSSFLTYLMMPISLNWVYGVDRIQLGSNSCDLQTRFAVLSRDMHCCREGCGVGPNTESMHIRKVSDTGVGVFDFFKTFCREHVGHSFEVEIYSQPAPNHDGLVG